MLNDKLQEIGNKLNVSEDDIKNFKRAKRKRKFLYPIIGGIIAILSTLSGYFMGKNEMISGYPFQRTILCCSIGGAAVGSVTVMGHLIGAFESKKLKFIWSIFVVTVFLSIIGFLSAYDIGEPVYNGALLYGVYDKKIGGSSND